MRKLLHIFVATALFLTVGTAFAQQRKVDKNEVIEKRIELLAENAENDDLDYTTLFDVLAYYFDHPLNLNAANSEDLRELGLLSEYQINSLIAHRIQFGAFQSIYEIRNVNGMDMETIQNILPFVETSTKELERFKLKNALKYGNHDVFMRSYYVFEEKKGYTNNSESSSTNNRYQGEPYSAYLRYRFQFRQNLSIGLTAEKDAGEEFFTGSNNQGFDYYSAHLFYEGKGTLKQLAIGDYQAQFGQGLTFWSGLTFGKSADVQNIQRYGRKLRPYTSVNENLFLRGSAATAQLGDFEITGFFSQKKIDANLVTSTDSLGREEVAFTSLQQTGLHRTISEIEDKQSVQETVFGGHLSFQQENFEVGATAVKSIYDTDANRNLRLYNQFDFNSEENLNLGLNFNANWNIFNFFGEVAQSENGAQAYVAGVNAALHSRFHLTFFNRNFDKDYQALYSGAFSESSRNQNERGMYVGATAKVSSTLTLKGYVDRYRFEWLRFLVDSPSEGGDVFLQANWRPNRKVEGYIRYRNETQKRNSQLENQTMQRIEEENQSWYRLHLDYRVSSSVRLKNRFEFTSYKLENIERSNGLLIYQDVQIHRPEGWLTFVGRFAMFDTDTYDSRIYAYENDVLYFFNVPAYAGRGLRTFAMVKFDISRHLDFWVRASRTYFTDRESIGTGLETINEPHRTDLRLQLRFRF